MFVHRSVNFFEALFPGSSKGLQVTQNLTCIIIIIIIIIIIDLFIEGSLISAQALFCLRALFGATRIHSFIRGWPL